MPQKGEKAEEGKNEGKKTTLFATKPSPNLKDRLERLMKDNEKEVKLHQIKR